jgi:hypothetical protein
MRGNRSRWTPPDARRPCPADHLVDPIQGDRARRFKQHLLVVGIKPPYREAAAAREPAERVGEPNRQAGQVVECEQRGGLVSTVSIVGGSRVSESCIE